MIVWRAILRTVLLLLLLGNTACATIRSTSPPPVISEQSAEQRLLDGVLRAYKDGDIELVRSFFIPGTGSKEIAYLVLGLETLVWPDKVIQHSFRILDTNFYVGDMDGVRTLMGDIYICDVVRSYSTTAKAEYSESFRLFYHVHFLSDRTKFESFSLPYVQKSNCAP